METRVIFECADNSSSHADLDQSDKLDPRVVVAYGATYVSSKCLRNVLDKFMLEYLLTMPTPSNRSLSVRPQG
jgi:hypothetical protein